MRALDVLYYSSSLGILLLVGAIWFLIYHMVQVLYNLQRILNDVHQVTKELKYMEDKIKVRVEKIPWIGGYLGKIFTHNE